MTIRNDTASDAYLLRKAALLPASLWSGFFWLTSELAMIFGAGILLGFVNVPLHRQ